jgi:hypothetical protein
MFQCAPETKERICPEDIRIMLAYVHKPPNNPSISQQDHDFGFDDTPMKDATAEEEKKHAPTQSSNDRKDARAECELAISQLSKSDQQVRTAKRVTWENRDDVKGQSDSSKRVNT